jgi:hypothetical protein
MAEMSGPFFQRGAEYHELAVVLVDRLEMNFTRATWEAVYSFFSASF